MRTEDMRNMIVAAGGSVDDLPDNLPSTLQKRLIETMGGNCPEGNLPSDICNAFGSCGGAQNVVFADGLTIFETFNAAITEFVVPPSVTMMYTGYTEVEYDDEDNMEVYEHNTWNDCPKLRKVTSHIVMNAFEYSEYIEEVVLTDGVTEINGGAFINCVSLNKITIPNTVTKIGNLAFEGCASLREITIPSSVTEIPSGAGRVFKDCANLTKIIINKPENSITGAPWGATNATVIWTG